MLQAEDQGFRDRGKSHPLRLKVTFSRAIIINSFNAELVILRSTQFVHSRNQIDPVRVLSLYDKVPVCRFLFSLKAHTNHHTEAAAHVAAILGFADLALFSRAKQRFALKAVWSRTS